LIFHIIYCVGWIELFIWTFVMRVLKPKQKAHALREAVRSDLPFSCTNLIIEIIRKRNVLYILKLSIRNNVYQIRIRILDRSLFSLFMCVKLELCHVTFCVIAWNLMLMLWIWQVQTSDISYSLIYLCI
jgi:hypothetical protein